MTKPKVKNHKAFRAVEYDGALLFPVLFLVGAGIVMVYSASSALALKKFGSDGFFLKKQALFALIGLTALVVCTHIPYRLYRYLTYPIVICAVAGLSAVLFSQFGHTAGGSTRWLRFGPLSFQPSEAARFALIIYLSYSMTKKQDRIKEFNIGFLPHLITLSIFVTLIIIQPDFGSAAIMCALAWIMLFVGGVKLKHLLSPLLILLPAAYIFMVNAEYRIKRIISFIDPWQYPTDEGYQIIHSFMAFGTGGMWGAGIGKGYQKLFYLPEPHTDFIFSVIGEETGLIGVVIVILLYGIILWRGISIAKNTSDCFGAYLAVGITILIGLQVCINMGVALGLLPPKGLTLPFLSYGGTSLLFCMASIGILMNIGGSK